MEEKKNMQKGDDDDGPVVEEDRLWVAVLVAFMACCWGLKNNKKMGLKMAPNWTIIKIIAIIKCKLKYEK